MVGELDGVVARFWGISIMGPRPDAHHSAQTTMSKRECIPDEALVMKKDFSDELLTYSVLAPSCSEEATGES